MSNASGGCVRLGVVVVALLAVPLSNQAAAQERPRPAVEFAAGSVIFVDDGFPHESLIGGAARFYVLPRVSVGPEVAQIRGQGHSHLMLTGNVTFDFLRPTGGQPGRVTPFVVVGGGFFQTREQFPSRPYTSYDGGFTAGGGIRVLVGERVIVGAEARTGWEPHLRFNGTIGVLLGR